MYKTRKDTSYFLKNFCSVVCQKFLFSRSCVPQNVCFTFLRFLKSFAKCQKNIKYVCISQDVGGSFVEKCCVLNSF